MTTNPCRLIENAKTDPDWDYELNAKLCGGDCKTCPHSIKDPNKEKADQLEKVIENLDKLKKIEPSEKRISLEELILSLKEEKEKLDNKPIEQKEEEATR